MSYQAPYPNASFQASQHAQSHFRPANQNPRGGLAGLGLSSTSADLSNKVNSFFDRDRTLPMYKDKPFAPRRTTRRRWKRLTGILGLCALVLLWYYYRPAVPSWQGSDSSDKGLGLWEWAQTFQDEPSKGPVDWNARREKVRDAFIVSWDGYEKEAWGKTILPNHARYQKADN